MAPAKKKVRKPVKQRASAVKIPAARKESAGLWFERLVRLQASLRAPNGCPWDVEQTHLTLRTYLIEEAYEVLEALESGMTQNSPKNLAIYCCKLFFTHRLPPSKDASPLPMWCAKSTRKWSAVIRMYSGKNEPRMPRKFSKTGNKSRLKSAARKAEG